MAINLSKMREKLTALENRGKKQDSVFWKPQNGEQTIRIVPTPDGDPFKEFWFHYNLGRNPGFLSPKRNFGTDDPLNDFVRNLFQEGTDESIKMAKTLMARQRFFAPVLVRGEEDQGVRIWGFGKRAYQALLNLVLNPEYGDITDVDTGTDLSLTYGTPPGASFPETTLTPRRRTSPLCDDAIGGTEECAKLLSSIPDFEPLFTKKTPAEIQVMLDEWLAADGEGAGEDVVKYDNKSSMSAVDKAYTELLGA
jgi:hypothetical protein